MALGRQQEQEDQLTVLLYLEEGRSLHEVDRMQRVMLRLSTLSGNLVVLLGVSARVSPCVCAQQCLSSFLGISR